MVILKEKVLWTKCHIDKKSCRLKVMQTKGMKIKTLFWPKSFWQKVILTLSQFDKNLQVIFTQSQFYKSFLQVSFTSHFYKSFLQVIFTSHFYKSFLQVIFTSHFYKSFLQVIFTSHFYKSFYTQRLSDKKNLCQYILQTKSHLGTNSQLTKFYSG